MGIVYYCEDCKNTRGWPTDLVNKRERRCHICGKESPCYFRDSATLPATKAPEESVVNKPIEGSETPTNSFTIDDSVSESAVPLAPKPRGRPRGSTKKVKCLVVDEKAAENDVPIAVMDFSTEGTPISETIPEEKPANFLISATEARNMRLALVEGTANEIVGRICKSISKDPLLPEIRWEIPQSKVVAETVIKKFEEMGYAVACIDGFLAISW